MASQRPMRYAVFLRGVNPMNLRMPELARALEQCGFSNGRTLLSSGNAVFDARPDNRAALETRIQGEVERAVGKTFQAFVRSASELADVVAQTGYPHPAGTKRVVVLLRNAVKLPLELPVLHKSWALLAASGTEAFGFHTPGQDSSAFMARLEKTFGAEFTTRTADTVHKCSIA